MIKISPFTPLFFSPSTDKFGVESRYIQVFTPDDRIVIQVLTDDGETVSGKVRNAVSGSSEDLSFSVYEMSSSVDVHTAVLTGLSEGYYTVSIESQESDIFHVTTDENELSTTAVIRYTSNTNKHRSDVVFVTDTKYEFQFRVPGGFKDNDWAFEVNNEQFEDGNGNIVELYAIESTQKTFTMGNAMGCPIWFGEHLNRILCCTHVHINDVRYVRKGSSTPEVTQEVQNQKSYIFRVQLQGMVENVDVELPSSSGDESESEGGGAGYVYLIKVGDNTRATDTNTYSALRMMLEMQKIVEEYSKDIEGKFIRKDKEDSTEYLLKLLGGAEFGDTVDSMLAGKGTLITPDGRIQTSRLEVRGSAQFMEFIINRLMAQESDFVFTESGHIEGVELLEEGTYLLTLRKRWQYDFTAFDDHDVTYGSMNTLLQDGSYFTSWFRVLSVDTSANTLTVALYPDDEVPGGVNYAPVVGMNISRRGNAINEERQNCWYISAREGTIMYLTGVTKPILEEYNYSAWLGLPKNLELFNGLPINYKQPYLFARGAIIQDLLRVDYQGKPIFEIVDLGPWDADTQYIKGKDPDSQRYIQHQTWYKSCGWRCAADKATVGVPPRWNNTQWVCVSGDGNYTLAITSSRGRFFRIGQEYTTLGFVLKHGDEDISVDAWQVEWTRESGLPDEDLLWNTEHADNVTTVEITPLDMPSNWREVRKVVFRCTVFLKNGEDVQNFSEEFSIT